MSDAARVQRGGCCQRSTSCLRAAGRALPAPGGLCRQAAGTAAPRRTLARSDATRAARAHTCTHSHVLHTPATYAGNQAEVTSLYKRFRSLDRGRKGYISAEELMAIPELSINPLAQRLVSAPRQRLPGSVWLPVAPGNVGAPSLSPPPSLPPSPFLSLSPALSAAHGLCMLHATRHTPTQLTCHPPPAARRPPPPRCASLRA